MLTPSVLCTLLNPWLRTLASLVIQHATTPFINAGVRTWILIAPLNVCIHNNFQDSFITLARATSLYSRCCLHAFRKTLCFAHCLKIFTVGKVSRFLQFLSVFFTTSPPWSNSPIHLPSFFFETEHHIPNFREFLFTLSPSWFQADNFVANNQIRESCSFFLRPVSHNCQSVYRGRFSASAWR